MFLLPDGRAALLVKGRAAPLLLRGPGVAALLHAASEKGLHDDDVAAAARSGATGTFRLLLTQGHLVRSVDPPGPAPLPPDTLDARRDAAVGRLPDGDGLVVLLLADHSQPACRTWVERAWQAGRTVLPIAFRPDATVVGPLAPPGLPCFGCALRRQAGLRPIEAALWSGTGGTRPLPIPADDLVVDPDRLAALVHAMLGRTGPPALFRSAADGESWHMLHPGPHCLRCSTKAARPRTPPSSPRALLDALAPWIGPEAGLATLLPAAGHGTPIRVTLAREALRQDTDELEWAITRGLSACTGKSRDLHEARLGAVAEAIERGALLAPPAEAWPSLPMGDDPVPRDGHVVGRCLRDGSAWRIPRASVQRPRRAGAEAEAWFEPCGTAFGRNEADAVDRALLERLERDAVLRWWRRRALLPPLSGSAALLDQVSAQLGPERAPPWLLDATTEAGLPVAIAVSARQDGGLPVLGFGAGWTEAAAADAALRELVAQERRLAAALARPTQACAGRDWSLADASEHGFLRPHATVPAGPRPGVNRAQVLRALADRGVRPLAVLHFTLWPGGPCVARVVAPGLQGLAAKGEAPPRAMPPAAPGWQPGPYPARQRNPWAFPG